MDKRTVQNKWTEESINYLKTAYLQGSPLKTIAARLNRSVSAINKTLARYNLRTHNRMYRLLPLSSPTAQQVQQKRNLGAQSRKNNTQEVKQFCIDDRQWVLFEHILFWLRTQKICVRKAEADVYYEVNGLPKNKQQILLIANLLREQRQLPIFFVKGITNS